MKKQHRKGSGHSIVHGQAPRLLSLWRRLTGGVPVCILAPLKHIASPLHTTTPGLAAVETLVQFF